MALCYFTPSGYFQLGNLDLRHININYLFLKNKTNIIINIRSFSKYLLYLLTFL